MKSTVWLATALVLPVLVPGCSDDSTGAAPIPAHAAFDKAELHLELQDDLLLWNLANLMAWDGATDLSTLGPAQFGLASDPAAVALGAIMGQQDDFYAKHPAGEPGDGKAGAWVAIYMASTAASVESFPYLVLVPSGSEAVTRIAFDQPDALRSCPSNPERWTTTSPQAVEVARTGAKFAAHEKANPRGDYLYNLGLNEGFWDGDCAPASAFWEITHFDMAAAVTGTNQAVVAGVHGSTGEFVEEAEFEISFLPDATGPLVLLDETWSYESLGQPPLFGEEPAIGSFTIESAYAEVTVFVQRSTRNLGPYADNLRVYNPDGRLEDQEAFSDQQVGNFFSTGNATISLADPVEGEWTVRYSIDHVDQTDTHAGRTIVTAKQGE